MPPIIQHCDYRLLLVKVRCTKYFPQSTFMITDGGTVLR